MPIATPVSTSNLFEVGSDTPGDGPFVYTFDASHDASAVVVQVQESGSDSFVTQTEDTHYTHTPATSTIEFTAGNEPSDGDLVYIFRSTNRERQQDYQAGSTITAQQLDDDNNQEFAILQEIESDLDNALRKDPSGTFWQCEGIMSKNALATDDPDGWPTLAQVQGIVYGGPGVQISGAQTFSYTGDGVETEFELTNWDNLITARVMVTINGLVQHAHNDAIYTIVNTDDTDFDTNHTWCYVSFVDPPANGDTIEIRIVTGIVVTTFDDQTISGDSIEDDAIALRHFSFPGVGERRLVFDAAGDAFLRSESIITPFQTALDTWLAAGQLSDLLNSATSPFGDEHLRMGQEGLPSTYKKVRFMADAGASHEATTLGQVQNLIASNIQTSLTFLGNITSGTQIDTDVGFIADGFAVCYEVNAAPGNRVTSIVGFFSSTLTVRVCSVQGFADFSRYMTVTRDNQTVKVKPTNIDGTQVARNVFLLAFKL